MSCFLLGDSYCSLKCCRYVNDLEPDHRHRVVRMDLTVVRRSRQSVDRGLSHRHCVIARVKFASMTLLKQPAPKTDLHLSFARYRLLFWYSLQIDAVIRSKRSLIVIGYCYWWRIPVDCVSLLFRTSSNSVYVPRISCELDDSHVISALVFSSWKT